VRAGGGAPKTLAMHRTFAAPAALRERRRGARTAPARALALLAVLAAGCATLTAPPPVAEMAAEPPAECRKVGDVEGSGVAWKLNPVEQQRSVARAEAMDRAKKMGATHVRFVDERSDAQGTVVHGVAYACP
jgi:hypothetical protein